VARYRDPHFRRRLDRAGDDHARRVRDPNRPGLDGETALHHAARSGKLKTIALLLARGARPDIYSGLGQLPGDIALKGERPPLFLVLGVYDNEISMSPRGGPEAPPILHGHAFRFPQGAPRECLDLTDAQKASFAKLLGKHPPRAIDPAEIERRCGALFRREEATKGAIAWRGSFWSFVVAGDVDASGTPIPDSPSGVHLVELSILGQRYAWARADALRSEDEPADAMPAAFADLIETVSKWQREGDERQREMPTLDRLRLQAIRNAISARGREAREAAEKESPPPSEA